MRFQRSHPKNIYYRIILSILLYALTLTLGGCSDGAPSPSADFLNQNSLAPTITTSLTPSAFGQSVTFTVKVPNTNGAAGNVTLYDGSNVLQANVPLAGGQAVFTTSTLEIGTHSITANYSGTAILTTNVSAPVTQTVVKAATSSELVSSVNPTVTGQSVTFTATISPPFSNSGTPTGNVTFAIDGVNATTVALSGNHASFTTTALTTGTHTIHATYSGDSHYTGTDSTFPQIVNKDLGGPTVGSSANPSVTGQSVTFTALVTSTSPGAGTPTGSVTFKDGSATLGTVVLNNSGGATFTTSSLSVGTHSITIIYSGDSNFSTATSPAISQVVHAATTQITISSSANPSAYGQNVTYSATVAPIAPGAGVPTGNLTISLNGVAFANVTLVNGQASTNTSAVPAGSNTFTVTYSGDSNFLASTQKFTQTVTQGNGGVTLGSSTNPSNFGDNVIFTATVSPTAPATTVPTGTVEFLLDGVTSLGIGTLNGSGSTTVSTNLLQGGSHTITAHYSGDANYTAQSSDPLTQQVNAAPTATTLVSDNNPSNNGATVTFTATVQDLNGTPLSGIPVTFSDGTNTATTNTDANGQTTYTTNTLTPGATATVTATSGATSDYLSSQASVQQVVNP